MYGSNLRVQLADFDVQRALKTRSHLNMSVSSVKQYTNHNALVY